MVAQTRSGTRRGTRGRSSRNNNSEDRKQNSKPMRAVRESPLAAAAVIGGTVAAGVFLWSRRNEIVFDGRTGFAKLAMEADVPIIPVVVSGAGETLLVPRFGGLAPVQQLGPGGAFRLGDHRCGLLIREGERGRSPLHSGNQGRWGTRKGCGSR